MGRRPDDEANPAESGSLARWIHGRILEFLADYGDRGLWWFDPVGVDGSVSVPGGFDDARERCRRPLDIKIDIIPVRIYPRYTKNPLDDGLEGRGSSRR